MRSKRAPGGFRRWLRRGSLITVLFFAGVILLGSSWWLPQTGLFLINAQAPIRADAIVVLAGDDRGERLVKGAELSRGGFGTPVYISASGSIYGKSYGELARQYAVSKGFPAQSFQIVEHDADSTREEAAILVDLLRSKQVHSANVVTSDYHTRRARRIFSRLTRDIDLRFVAAPSWNFRYDNWWQSRRSQKILFLEYVKTVADWLGI